MQSGEVMIFNSPRPIRRLISGAGLAAAIVLMHAPVTEAAIAADQTVSPPVKLDLVSQGAAISAAERTNMEQSPSRATEVPATGAGPAASAPVADALLIPSSQISAVAHIPLPADARRSRRARDIRISRGPRPAEVHASRCSDGWCGRQLVLMLGIGY